MNDRELSFVSAALLWFGAAVSIAEILTGALLAPLGFAKGMATNIVGHLIGCTLLYLAGLIGAKSKSSAMETVRFSFGREGSIFFSILNILQLIGWTAIMIISASRALDAAAGSFWGGHHEFFWCLFIGALIILWVLTGIKNVSKLNVFAVGSLLALTVILGAVVFRGEGVGVPGSAISFGMAMELSIAMPLSWLPLISDYTKNTNKPVAFTFFSTLFYFIGSTFMYAIGLGAAIFTGNSDIVQILTGAGLGMAAVLIVILSTVTTTYLDVYSVGESALNINPKLNGKMISVAACVIGTLIAMFVPIEQYENFLYLIGSVFVPMIVILMTDYFILNKKNEKLGFDRVNFTLWLMGFTMYRVYLHLDMPIGSTLPVIFSVSLLCVAVHAIRERMLFRGV